MAEPTSHSELDQLISQARGADLPSAERLARVRARLLQPPGGGGGPGEEPSGGAGSAGSSVVGTGSPVWTWVLSIVGTGFIALGGTLYLGSRAAVPPSAAPSAPIVAPAASLPPPSAAEPVQPSAADPAQPSAAEPAPRAPPAAKVKRVQRAARSEPSEAAQVEPPRNTFAAEVSLLQAAILAERQGERERARELLADHVRRFPDSQLGKERDRLTARLEQ